MNKRGIILETKINKIAFSKVVFYFIIFMFLLIQIYPIIWFFISSFRPNIELTSQPFSLPRPSSLTLSNYERIFKHSNLLLYLKNTIIVAATSSIFIVLLSSTAAFAIEKLKFKYSSKVLIFFLIGLMVPVQVVLIPLFLFYRNLNMLNSYWSLILPQVGFALPMSILLFVYFYKYIPDEIIEAAVIDGCSTYKVFYKIIIPLSINVIVTVVAINSIFIWNDFIFCNTFISGPAHTTIARGLQDFVGHFGLTDWGATFGAIFFNILPPVFIYFALSKRMITGLTSGAVKK